MIGKKGLKSPLRSVVWPVAAVLVLALCSLQAGSSAQKNQLQYVLVVNAANSFQAGGNPRRLREVTKQLFLKERSQWPNILHAKPYSRSSDSPEQRAFMQRVLGLTEIELVTHWISLKQRTGQTRPREVASDRILIRFVERSEGAFGVLPKDSLRGASDRVKVLFSF